MTTDQFAPGAFPESMYPRSCPSCGWGFLRDAGNEDPLPVYCPRCGIGLERMACGSCGAPVLLWHAHERGKHEVRRSPRCPWCGEPPEKREPQMRTKPKPPTPSPTQPARPVIGPFIIKG